LPFLLEEFFGGARANQNDRQNFLRGSAAALRQLAAGFRSSEIFAKVGSSLVVYMLHYKKSGDPVSAFFVVEHIYDSARTHFIKNS